MSVEQTLVAEIELRKKLEVEVARLTAELAAARTPFPACAKGCGAAEHLGVGECESVCPWKFCDNDKLTETQSKLKAALALDLADAKDALKYANERREAVFSMATRLAMALGALAKKHPEIETEVTMRRAYPEDKMHEMVAEALEEYVQYINDRLGVDLMGWQVEVKDDLK